MKTTILFRSRYISSRSSGSGRIENSLASKNAMKKIWYEICALLVMAFCINLLGLPVNNNKVIIGKG